jgi:mRNA interferase MazF
MLIKKGDVVRVLFPNSNLATAKRRPALVVQSDNLNTGIRQTVLAMITSNMFRANHPSRVTVLLGSADGISAGIRLDSIIMTDNLVTISDSEIDSILGTLPNMSEVETALRHTFGLE